MQEPIQERGRRRRRLGRSPGSGSGDGSLLGGSRHDLTPTQEGIVPSTDRVGWGRSISVQRGNKVILYEVAIGNQTRWPESSPKRLETVAACGIPATPEASQSAGFSPGRLLRSGSI